MKVRAQVSMVFNLDKCIGCHTCSIACKNIWTDRKGAEYMWWNNVETKPGTGYPTLWEDQEKYRGGWERNDEGLRLRLHSRGGGLAKIFFNPHLPTIDDYYEPWTYRYGDLLGAPAGDDQPVARPVSLVTGNPIDIEAGPNWDDDLGGSSVYGAHDPNLGSVSEGERRQLFLLERMVLFYLPRICNHCANPGCVAACPAGAIYKRGEDGIVLVNQEKCRAGACAFRDVPTRRSITIGVPANRRNASSAIRARRPPGACLFPFLRRADTLPGRAPLDAERIEGGASRPDRDLVHAQREMILDPSDPEVVKKAKEEGIHEAVLAAARKSPVYRFVKEWRLALPLHPEFGTVPMLYYVPPLLPLTADCENGRYNLSGEFFGSPEQARLPLRYLASLFSAGNEEIIREVYRKLMVVRVQRRAVTMGETPAGELERLLAEAGVTPFDVEAIYHMTSLAGFDERHVVPPFMREMAMEMSVDPADRKGEAGVGFLRPPKRGW